MSREDSARTTVDEWPKGEGGEAAVGEEEWSEEKEQQMLMLEERLRKAQMGWSDEQEEILGPVSWPGSFFVTAFVLLLLPSLGSLRLLELLLSPICNTKYGVFRYLTHAAASSVLGFFKEHF